MFCFNWLFFSSLGNQLKKMLQEHGSFEAMEIAIKKINQKAKSESALGGWYTETYLQTHEGWTKSRA